MILIFGSLFDYLKSPILENQCQYLLYKIAKEDQAQVNSKAF